MFNLTTIVEKIVKLFYLPLFIVLFGILFNLIFYAHYQVCCTNNNYVVTMVTMMHLCERTESALVSFCRFICDVCCQFLLLLLPVYLGCVGERERWCKIAVVCHCHKRSEQTRDGPV